MNRTNAGCLEFCFYAEIEIRCVNAHENARTNIRDALEHGAAQHQNTRKLLEYLNVTAHRQAVCRIPAFKTCSEHFFAAHAELRRTVHALGNFREHKTREKISAGFAGKPRGTVGIGQRLGLFGAEIGVLLSHTNLGVSVNYRRKSPQETTFPTGFSVLNLNYGRTMPRVLLATKSRIAARIGRTSSGASAISVSICSTACATVRPSM